MRQSPAVRRRKLGEELRRLRDKAGLTSPEAARLVGWHQSKVSRIETGRSAVKPSDVTRLLDVYGVTDPRLRELVNALTSPPAHEDGKHWWHAYRGLLPPQYRDGSYWRWQNCLMSVYRSCRSSPERTLDSRALSLSSPFRT